MPVDNEDLDELRRKGLEKGRYTWLRGWFVYIPRHADLRREIDGHEFTSSPGTTDIYRDGELAEAEGEAPCHADLEKPEQPDIRKIGTPEF